MTTPIADENGMDSELERWLARAYPGPDCPPPEAWLSDSGATDAERARLDAHADACPACAAERALARAFEAGGEPSADVEAIVARLRKGAPWRQADVAPISFATRRSGRRRPLATFLALPLAMAAALVLAVGAILRFGAPGAPPVGAPGTGAVMRGNEIEVVAPRGELAAVPEALTWVDVPDAASYRVSILGVDGEELWSERVSGSPATLDETSKNTLHAAVRYRWQVEALDADGARIAWSNATPFRIRPGAGEADGS
jgi:hypothetical protein